MTVNLKMPQFFSTGLPPSRAGVAKTPFGLAGQSGEIGLGQALEKFGGATLDRLTKQQAANEVSDARGQTMALVEEFSTIVASRPNASFDELQTFCTKIANKIKALPDQLKTGLAKE